MSETAAVNQGTGMQNSTDIENIDIKPKEEEMYKETNQEITPYNEVSPINPKNQTDVFNVNVSASAPASQSPATTKTVQYVPQTSDSSAHVSAWASAAILAVLAAVFAVIRIKKGSRR